MSDTAPAEPWVLIRKGSPLLRFQTLDLAQRFYDQLRFNAGAKAPAAVFGPNGEAWYCSRQRAAYWVRGERRLRGFEDDERGSGRSDLVDIAGELRRETDAAFLIFDGKQEVWVPKSQVEHDPRDGTFAMPEWMAREKGLI